MTVIEQFANDRSEIKFQEHLKIFQNRFTFAHIVIVIEQGLEANASCTGIHDYKTYVGGGGGILPPLKVKPYVVKYEFQNSCTNFPHAFSPGFFTANTSPSASLR